MATAMTTEARLAHLERQEGRILELLERNQERMAQNERQIAAVQNLWVRLCKRHGWLEDED